MSCQITSRVVSDVVVVDLSGKLCFLEVGLRNEVRDLLEEGHREFVLNLSDVPYVDSFGLGQLITVWTSIQRAQGKMTLFRPTEHVRKLLEITRLDTVFSIVNDERDLRVRHIFSASA